MMQFLSKREFETLANTQTFPCVSLYLPTHVAGAEIQQDPIRLKNLLSEAERQLLQRQWSSSDIETLLAPAAALLDDNAFWRHQQQGLALFLTVEHMRSYRLPIDVDERAVVGDRFHLTPLMPLFTATGHFYILALSQNQVRLFQATRYQIVEVSLDDLNDLPTSLEEALKYDDPEKQLQYHSGDMGGAPIYHGQGVGTTDNKEAIRRFCLKIDRGLQPYLSDETAPLILASVDYLQPIYREANSYTHLLHEGISGNPEPLEPEQLRDSAWSIVEPHMRRSQHDALNRFSELLGTGQAGTDLAQIVPAAVHGQVDILFVAEGANRWGQFDPTSQQIEEQDGPTPENGDLLSLAAMKTFLQGGQVFIQPADQMPQGADVAAIYRYEIPAQVYAQSG